MNDPMITRSVYSRQVRWFASALVASSLWIVSPADAKMPQQIFAEASPSIVVVEVSDAAGKLEATGSGVVIAKGEVITNCHVAAEGKTLQIKLGNVRYPATIHYADRDRDLCQLSAPKLAAPSATLGDVKSLSTGERVVAIGAPEGLELSISEGLISALRNYGDGSKIIQTTAAISPGSSGGGLFDEEARLVGFTTFTFKEGQNLNFALPVSWISELPERVVAVTKRKSGSLDWITVAVALEQKKDWTALQAHSYRWTQSDPRNAIAWFSLGKAFGMLGQFHKAIDANREAVRIDPTYADAWYNIGIDYNNSDQSPLAIEAYREALRIDPNRASAWYNLGNAYAHIHQYDLAVQAEREALRIDPRDADAWFNLGVVYSIQGNHQGVIEAYQSLRTLNQKKADELFDLAIAPN